MIRRALITENRPAAGELITGAETDTHQFETLSPGQITELPDFQRLKYGMVFYEVTEQRPFSAAELRKLFPSASIHSVSRCYEPAQEQRALALGFREHFFLPLAPALLEQLSEEAARVRVVSTGKPGEPEPGLASVRELTDVMENIGVRKDYHSLVRRAHRLMLAHVPARTWTVYSRPDERADWQCEFTSSTAGDNSVEGWYSVFAQAIERQSYVLGRDGESRSGDSAAIERESDYVCYPINLDGKIIGVMLGVGCQRPGGFNEGDLARLEVVSRYLASAHRCIELVRENEKLSFTDSLTCLYNYRYLRQFLTEEIKRSARYRKRFALLFIDIDWFKGVNDTHGHLVGSELLNEVGQMFRSLVRDADVIVRYGGDEYVIVLTEATAEGAQIIAERVLHAIAGHHFGKERGLDIKITISIGLATYPEHGDTVDGLIRKADLAMYEAKNLSKNCVKSAS